jgi:hypothetical protein
MGKMAYSEALNRIYNNLKNGESYGSVSRYREDMPGGWGGKEYFHCQLSYSSIYKLFRWTCFGSSANRATKKELSWIIRKIFNTTPAEFERRYITKSAFEKTERMAANV